ncbi:hypothetical protein FACS1894198_1620 [Clostridia bacterium]|nr:hypothetical protein FACS1894198_1620 [Clostridia bacterium]
MLENINLNDRSYNDIMERAINMLPILSKEWTDYNDSDPGITLLQLFAVLTLLQQSYADTVGDEIKSNLLKLLGYVREPVRAPIAISSIATPKDQMLPKNTRFLSDGDLAFELREDFLVTSNSIKKVLSVSDEGIRDITDIVTNGLSNNFAKIFEWESVRRELCIGFEKPVETGDFVSLYFDFANAGEGEDVFFDFDTNVCDVAWECFTKDGWKSLCVEDGTVAFSKSGTLRFKPSYAMEEYKDSILENGLFYIRARVVDGRFDVALKLKRLLINAVQLFGQETMARTVNLVSAGGEKQTVNLSNGLVGHKKFLVMCEEEGCFRLYCEHNDVEPNPKGRYYMIKQKEDGTICLEFDKERFGFAPMPNGTKIRIVTYSPELADSFNLGRVVGFDGQRFEFNLTNLSEFGLKLMLKVEDSDGVKFIDCNKVGANSKNVMLAYSLDYDDNSIVLHNNICCSGELIITSCIYCAGKNGNVVAGERFVLGEAGKALLGNIEAHSIYNVQNGKDRESLDELIRRMVWDMESTGVAVTKEDYLSLLKEVPGITIEKINIILKSEQNEVVVAVKLKSDDEMPKLSSRHKEILGRHIEEHRQLTTNVNFVSPHYIPIDATGRIYVKQDFKEAESIIYDVLKYELDGIRSDVEFGRGVVYGDIYSKIEKLPCVEYIESLSFDSRSMHAKKDGNGNVVLDPSALGYLADFQIVIDNKLLTVV